MRERDREFGRQGIKRQRESYPGIESQRVMETGIDREREGDRDRET